MKEKVRVLMAGLGTCNSFILQGAVPKELDLSEKMDSASMSVQHQGGSHGTHPTHNQVSLHLNIQSAKSTELNEQLSAGDDFALKVRKPYTMTKQRERWTDEEHKKFLDALELYGRAWKHIEAHVGTKTAVQIRSHAQKFFSKVERESDNGDLCTGKPIEIPPPRPKRKPHHPYPRKLLSTVNSATPAPEKQMSLSPQREAHQSPTSVLSASCLNTPIHSLTPGGSNMSDSSNVCANSVSLVIPELPHSSPKVEASLSSENLSKCQDQHDRKSVKQEFVEDNGFVKEGSEEISPTQCFKLFGKTVLVTNCCRPSSPISGAGKTQSSDLSSERSSPTLPAVSTPVKPTSGDMSAMPCWPQPPLCSLLTQGGGMHVKYFQTFSRQADQEGPLIPFVKVHSSASIKVQPLRDNKEEAQSTETREKGCSDGVPAEFNSLRNIRLLDDQLAVGEKSIRKPRATAFSEKRGRSFKCLEGFMPYKRCKAEHDAQSAIKHEENEQGIRLCL